MFWLSILLSTASTCGTSAKDRISAESERLSLPVWSQRNPVRNGHNWEIRTDTFMASENVATPSLEYILPRLDSGKWTIKFKRLLSGMRYLYSKQASRKSWRLPCLMRQYQRTTAATLRILINPLHAKKTRWIAENLCNSGHPWPHCDRLPERKAQQCKS